MQQENAEYSEENLCFKEFRNDGYLDKLKDMRPNILTQELSLESLQQAISEAASRGILSSTDIYKARAELERVVCTQVIVYNNGKFIISNVKESEVDALVHKLSQLDLVDSVHKYSSGKYDFTNIMLKSMPAKYFTIDGQLKLN